MKRVYFDYNATTPIHPDVAPYLKKMLRMWGNPSSLHKEGRDAFAVVAEARAHAAAFIGATPEDIVFTSSGSEANNWILYHFYREAVATQFPVHVVLSAVEHPCLLRACEAYQGPLFSYTCVPVDRYGRVDVSDVLAACRDTTRLVSLMLVNNELGTVQPVYEVAKALADSPILCHTDAIQAAGKVMIDVGHMPVDFLTLSAHKAYAPKGVGLLYMRRKKKYTLMPMIYGGGQEHRYRAGTENVLGIGAFGHALSILSNSQISLQVLCREIGEVVLAGVSDIPGATVYSPSDGVCNTLSVGFAGVQGHALAMRLDLAGVAVSTGAACSTGAIEPSHVLLAAGLYTEKAKEVIRISWGLGVSIEDAAQLLRLLASSVADLRHG